MFVCVCCVSLLHLSYVSDFIRFFLLGQYLVLYSALLSCLDYCIYSLVFLVLLSMANKDSFIHSFIAIACRLSVCLSVCLSVTSVDCDHIGWNTSEIISPLVSLGCSLSPDPNIVGLFQGEYPQIWAQSDPPPVDLSVGDIR